MKKNSLSLLAISIIYFNLSPIFYAQVYSKELNDKKDNNSVKSNIFQNKLALLILVNQYQDEHFACFNQLNQPLIDFARDLNTISQAPYNPKFVYSLFSQNAKYDKIVNILEESNFNKALLPDDFIFVYIGSICYLTKDNIYFCCFDSKYNNANPAQTKNMVDLTEFITKIRIKSGSKSIVLGLDILNHKFENYKTIIENIAKKNKISIIAINNQSNENNSSEQTHEYLINALVSNVEQKLYTIDDLKQNSKINIFSTNPKIGSLSFDTKVSYKEPKDNRINFGYSLTDLYMRRPNIALAKHNANSESNEDNDSEPVSKNDFANYMKQIKKIIDSNWQKPKTLNSIRIIAVFNIDKDGKILDPKIVSSSGDADLDNSAIDALNKSSPLPKLPDSIENSIEIRYKFQWDVK